MNFLTPLRGSPNLRAVPKTRKSLTLGLTLIADYAADFRWATTNGNSRNAGPHRSPPLTRDSLKLLVHRFDLSAGAVEIH
jgi:hypothetical protein